ncbi:MAG: hypothetical protein ACTSSP_04010 [Candidatus Asgardarchaeia archaeon]
MEKISEQLLEISGFLSEQLKYTQANAVNQVGIILRDNKIHTIEQLKYALEKDDVVDLSPISPPDLEQASKCYQINSVFGIGKLPCFDDPNMFYVFVSDKDTWVNNKCCADFYSDDTSNALNDYGFGEAMDGIWESGILQKREAIWELMTKLGFEFDKSFEDFMIDSMESE